MSTRTETAAATRSALVRAAGELLDAGGPEGVTLRAVGARAGVSRGAPYGHFENKEDLLTALAVEAWRRVGQQLGQMQADSKTPGAERLRAALRLTLDLARRQPHLYALMFATPGSNPEPLIQAASSAQDLFLAIIADSVSGADPRQIGALLMSTVHGIASMELAGQLDSDKWNTTGDQLLETIVRQVTT